MHERDLQAVLRCKLCNKPFDKESTLKRHGYYCRSRRDGKATRVRSCISCARGKARCDNGQPGCSRCTAKGIECHYPAKTSNSRGLRSSHAGDTSIPRVHGILEHVAEPSHQQATNDVDASLQGLLDISDADFANLGSESFDWNEPYLIDFAEFMDLPIDSENTARPSSDCNALVSRSPTGSAKPAGSIQNYKLPHTPIPISPSTTIRSLVQKPKLHAGPQRMILHTLRSYPLMMLRHNTLPPFIHPRLISTDFEEGKMEPLANCVSLVHMISSGVQGSRKLFWKNVRLECERLCAEILTLSKWELVTAMQALSIYILIRLDEGETDDNNYDYLLLATVIAQQLACVDIVKGHKCGQAFNRDWKHWIFEESRRRLAIIYRVVAMLFYFEPAAMCELQTDLVLAPLPGKKQLWEANDESVWLTESERDPAARTSFALAANGELVELDEGQLFCGDLVLQYNSSDGTSPSRRATHWEQWCSGVDAFGGLVLLAASLVG
ncbi:hypothetical protein BDV96DRAFT_639543 [Lophiotrema nucula]|uniref:Zn(2)-C6 fungal-type domain-containing protein n=1 Tax=Lophiotrema nucula TaxID=690887 RepID=A0A6A5ZTE7_9PLEO|nr:hypothetical protein BDV96DRAFT_639543 [Lophiotrema nucula]